MVQAGSSTPDSRFPGEIIIFSVHNYLQAKIHHFSASIYVMLWFLNVVQ